MVTRIRKSKRSYMQWSKEKNTRIDKQWFTRHCTENYTLGNTSLNENNGQLGCFRKSFKIAFQNDCIYSN